MEREKRDSNTALQRYNYQHFKDLKKKKTHMEKISVEIQDKTNLHKVTERAN